MASESAKQWEGKTTTSLLKSTAEEVWPLLEDFCNFHKWLPTLDTCHKVDGADGLVRYCASTLPSPLEGGDCGGLRWCREKLVAIDPVGKWLTYEIMENNLGFKVYKSTLKVVPVNGGGDPSGCQINGGSDPSGCRIEWSFVADPVEGLGYEDFCGYLDLNLQGMAKNIEKALELSA